jgi:hypothetical protein
MDLAVNPRNAILKHNPCKMRKCALARIGYAGKHRLSKKARTYRNAVKTTDKFVILPSLKGVRKPKAVKLTVPLLTVRRKLSRCVFST